MPDFDFHDKRIFYRDEGKTGTGSNCGLGTDTKFPAVSEFGVCTRSLPACGGFTRPWRVGFPRNSCLSPGFSDASNLHRGEGAGPLLVLLPGNTSSSALHDGEMEFFRDRFRVICPDYVGCGRSERVGELPIDFWWENALSTVELVRSLGAGPSIAIGASGGALVALNMAVIAPELVACVVADSFAGEYITPEWAGSIVEGRRARTRGQVAFYLRAHGADWETVVDADSKMLLAAAARGESLCHRRLPEITCPVLLTASLADDLVPHVEKGMCAVARQIATSRTAFYPSGTHPLMWSRPSDFRREVLDFLRCDCKFPV